MATYTSAAYDNPEQLADYSLNAGNYTGTDISPRGNGNANGPYGAFGVPKINTEPSDTERHALTSALSVHTLPDNYGSRLNSNHVMFLINPKRDLPTDTYTALPLVMLNQKLELRQKYLNDSIAQPLALIAARKRKGAMRDEEWIDDFPTEITEFQDKVKPYGILGNKMASSQENRLYPTYGARRSTEGLFLNFSLKGKVDIGNYWGNQNGGTDVGFGVVKTRSMYPGYYNLEGDLVPNFPTAEEFLQIVPVYREVGGAIKSVLRYRNDKRVDDMSLRYETRTEKQFESVSYKNLVTEKMQDTAPTTGFVWIDWSSPPVKETGRDGNKITLDQFEEGYCWKLGTIKIPSAKTPSDMEIQKALRSFTHADLLAKTYKTVLTLLPSLTEFSTFVK